MGCSYSNMLNSSFMSDAHLLNGSDVHLNFLDNIFDSKINLQIKLSNLPIDEGDTNFSILMVVFLNEGRKLWKEIYRSDVVYIPGKEYEFMDSIPMIYKFEVPQLLRFRVYKVIDFEHPNDGIDIEKQTFLGENEHAVSKLVMNEESRVISKLTVKSEETQIVMVIDVLENSPNELVSIKLAATEINYPRYLKSPKPLCVFLRETESTVYSPIAHTQTVNNAKDTFEFPTLVTPYPLFCGNNPNCQFIIEVNSINDDGSTVELGSNDKLNFKDLQKKTPITLKDINKNRIGKIDIIDFDIINTDQTFYNYIKNGLQFQLNIHMSFTTANGPYSSPDSFHYLSENLNSYQLIITKVIDTLDIYLYNHQINLFALGSKTNNTVNISYKMNDNPLTKIEDVMECYSSAVKTLNPHTSLGFSGIFDDAISTLQILPKTVFLVEVMIVHEYPTDIGSCLSKIDIVSNLPVLFLIINIQNDSDKRFDAFAGTELGLFLTGKGLLKRNPFLVTTIDNKSIKKSSALTHSIHSIFERLPERVIEYYRLYNIPLFKKNNNNKNENETEEINSVNKIEEEGSTKEAEVIDPDSIDVTLSNVTSDTVNPAENGRKPSTTTSNTDTSNPNPPPPAKSEPDDVKDENSNKA